MTVIVRGNFTSLVFTNEVDRVQDAAHHGWRLPGYKRGWKRPDYYFDSVKPRLMSAEDRRQESWYTSIQHSCVLS